MTSHGELLELTWRSDPEDDDRGSRIWRRPAGIGIGVLVTLGVALALVSWQLVRADRVLLAIGAGTLATLMLPAVGGVISVGRRQLRRARTTMRIRLTGDELVIESGDVRRTVDVRRVPAARMGEGVVVLKVPDRVVIPVARVDPDALHRLVERLSAPQRAEPAPPGLDPYAPPGA